MADNTDDEQLDSPTNTQSENPQDNNILTLETEPIKSTQETQEMEVHHHAHHEGKKNWKSYGWEFLMLFLAVFCGFLAEYQLEHVIENQREKQYVQSLIEDLKNDQVVIDKHIATVQTSALMMDTLVNILNNPATISDRRGDLYYFARLAPRLSPLSINSRTFEQLKNSGNFRLIKNLTTSNRIMNYYENLPLLRMLESINETEFSDYKQVASKIFYSSEFIKMEGMDNDIQRSLENPLLRTTNNDLFQELSVFAVYMRGTKKGVIANTKALKFSGAALLKYLQDEYHLE